MDTVHKPGSFGDDLFRRDGEYVYGPGAYDCKGGIAIAVLVMKALMAFGYDKRQLKLILSGDEEVAHSLSGGKGIDVYTEEIAGCAAAFNCESGLLNGDVVTRRKAAESSKSRSTAYRPIPEGILRTAPTPSGRRHPRSWQLKL